MSEVVKLNRILDRLIVREKSLLSKLSAPGGDTKKNETLLREVVSRRKEALASAAEAEYEESQKKKNKEKNSPSRRRGGAGGGMPNKSLLSSQRGADRVMKIADKGFLS